MSARPEQMVFPDLVVPELPHEASLDDRFVAFHLANPHVFGELRRLALDLVGRGYRRISIGMLVEVVRYSALQTRPDASGYKINNSYRSRYARLLADSSDALADAFEMRELRS